MIDNYMKELKNRMHAVTLKYECKLPFLLAVLLYPLMKIQATL
jgi:hypothetical protein